MAKPLKLVIFDCDGTLVDSQLMILGAMRSAYAGHGLPVPDRETLLSIVGLSLPQAFEKLGQGAAGFPVVSLCDGYRASFHAKAGREDTSFKSAPISLPKSAGFARIWFR